MKTLFILLSLSVILGFGPPVIQAQVGVILEDSVKKDDAKKDEAKKDETKKDEAKPAEPATPAAPAAPTAPTDPNEPASTEPAPSRVTLNLVSGCEINAVESVVLHMKGISGVDVETQKGSLIVDYESYKVNPQQIIDRLAREKGCFARMPSAVVGGTGK